MSEVRSAIHVRTGQRSVVEALDAWLAQHGVAVTPCSDVYEACVHLLKHYARIPDLALLGADWLADDELSLVTYIRQTWPHTGIIVYGGGRETPVLAPAPLTLTCRTEAAVRDLLKSTPSELLQRLTPEGSALPAAPPPVPVGPLSRREIEGLPPLRPGERDLAVPGAPPGSEA